jgi:hypothetical protein
MLPRDSQVQAETRLKTGWRVRPGWSGSGQTRPCRQAGDVAALAQAAPKTEYAGPRVTWQRLIMLAVWRSGFLVQKRG